MNARTFPVVHKRSGGSCLVPRLFWPTAEGPDVISNHSSYHSRHTLARTPEAAMSRSGARVLLHTAAILSLAGPRRAGEGRAVRHGVTGPGPELKSRRRTDKARCGLRVRESAQPARVDGRHSFPDGAGTRKKKKGRAVGARQPRGPAGGRTGSTPAAASRRQQRAAQDKASAAQDPAPRRPRSYGHVARSYGHVACTPENSHALGQRNFTRIKEDLGACYWLVEDIHLQGDQSPALPVGNTSHPFTGRLDAMSQTLSINLTRSRGDAVLFGAIERSWIRLAVVSSHLETRHGQRAALIGEMGAANRVTLSRLHDSHFFATGTGRAEAGLVGTTLSFSNRLTVRQARGNQIGARALAPASCSGACPLEAAVSLGLGVMVAPGDQSLIQHGFFDNWLQAEVVRPGQTGDPDDRAAAALLGILHPGHRNVYLWGTQQGLANNTLIARVSGDAARGHSCSSLGYAGLGCDRFAPDAPVYAWQILAQTDCRDNNLQAWSGATPIHNSTAPAVRGGLARVGLVGTEAFDRLYLLHRGVAAGQLQAAGSGAQRGLVPPAQSPWLILLAGDSSAVPFSFPGAYMHLENHDIQLDTAAFPLAVGDHEKVGKLSAIQWRFDSRKPPDWRWLHDALRAFKGWTFRPFPDCAGQDSALHLPYEALQSLTSSQSQWLLVTRQRYPFRPENNPQGLLRVSYYRKPATDHEWPQTQARAWDILGVHLYAPRAGDGVLQDRAPVHALVEGNYLFQLYQGPGLPIQLVSVPLNVTKGAYHLTQYEGLQGQARLLSVEEGELHLWTQGDRDTLFAYGLGGAVPATNDSSWLHLGFDLSDQPGGPALLGRDGNWLYSLRQNGWGFASLRRRNLTTGATDAHWQKSWSGQVFASMRLSVAHGRLNILPGASLADPRQPGFGLQARVPDEGGCLQWKRLALVGRYFLPEGAAEPTAGTQAAPVSSVTGTAGTGTAVSSASPTTSSMTQTASVAPTRYRVETGEREPDWPGVLRSIGIGTGATVAGALVIVVFAGTCCLVRRYQRHRARVAQRHALQDQAQELPPDQAPQCTLSEETAV